MPTQQPANQRGAAAFGLKNLAAYLLPRESVVGLLIPLALIALYWLVEASK